jgi:hypothetical protein
MTPIISVANSTSTPLNAGISFTGTAHRCLEYSVLVVSCKTDQDGSLFVDFSTNGSDWDSTLTYSVSASVNEVHRLKVSKEFYRIRMTNTPASNQSYLRLQTILSSDGGLTSPLNSAIQQDSDAVITRGITEELSIATGLFTGYSIINKFGRNPDIDTGSVPEDIWNGGGVYTGFPTGSPEEFQVFSSDAGDTGVLMFSYLASNTSTSYQTATVTLQGTTPVNTGVTGYRVHTAQYVSGSSTAFNTGTITIRHRTTTANVFCQMPIGRSQSNVSGYTIPSGYTGYIRRLFCRIVGSASGSVDGSLWVRTLNGSPRLRRPFSAATADHFEETPYGGISISSGSDVIVRITAASANNLEIIAGYDLVLVKN